MGYAIADAFAEMGAEVTLISGPVNIQTVTPGIELIKVTSAAEMFSASKEYIHRADIAVFAAAVADFTVENAEKQKIKHGMDDIILKLSPTADIAGTLGKKKRKDQLFIGFALETSDGVKNALDKMNRKNFDLIVLNSLEDKGAGFGTDTNKVTMIDKSGNIDTFDLKQKDEVARDIVMKTIKLIEDA